MLEHRYPFRFGTFSSTKVLTANFKPIADIFLFHVFLFFQLSGFSAQSIFRVMVIAHNPPIVQVWPGSVGRCMLLYYHHRRNQDPSQMLKQDWKSYYKFTFKGRICSVGPALGLLPNGHQFESPQGHWRFTRLLTSPWE